MFRIRNTFCLVAYLAMLGGGLRGVPVSAQSCSDEVIRQNRAATVFIKVKKTLKVTGQVEERTGTGFIISPSGYVLTNKHVIDADEKVDEIKITGAIASREEASASRLTLIDANQHDVALLKFADTSKTYKTVALGQVANVKVGTHLCSEGFPTDKEYFFAEGPMSGTGAERGLWFTQMPSNPGDSGAPVFLNSGEVVAIKVGGYEGLQNVNLLIPMNFAQELLNEVPDVPRPAIPVPDVDSGDVDPLNIQLKKLAQSRLTVSPALADRYADVVKSADAGITKLMSDGSKLENAIRGGGTYWAFLRRGHEYNYGSDIQLQGSQFATSFAGADYGYILRLGKTPIRQLLDTASPNPPSWLDQGRHEAWKYMWNYVPPRDIKEIRQQQAAARGLVKGNATLSETAPAIVDEAYLLRSIQIDRSDILVAFQVVDRGDDGSMVLVWKIVAVFDTPVATGRE